MLAANPSQPLPNAIFLMGPTASGKTDLAVALAQHLPCDIISVDSALVYRGMNIGTAKPDAATLARAPHSLLDLADPAEPYSAAQFRRDALKEMATATARGRIPLLVGGTMLYFKVLLEGIADLPPADPAIRAALQAEAGRVGWPAMHQRLATVDPAAALRLHPNHSQRILRALEVYEQTGMPLTQWQQASSADPLPYRTIQLALLPADREVLYRRIAARFDRMLEAGFIREVQQLYQRGDLSPALPSVRAVGYRQAWDYLEGRTDFDTFRAAGIAATRQLAKRQLTWLRSWPDLHAITVQEPFDLDDVIQDALKTLREAGIYNR